MALLQIHHQFKDGTTNMCAQREINSHSEVMKFMEDTEISHPLPEDAHYLCCDEKSKHFWIMKNEGEVMDTCPECNAKQIGGCQIPGSKKYKCGTWFLPNQGPCTQLQRTEECYIAQITQLKARIEELEAETRKVEITCLSCGIKFSVNEGEDEINWTCPICPLKADLKVAQERLKELEAVLEGKKK